MGSSAATPSRARAVLGGVMVGAEEPGRQPLFYLTSIRSPAEYSTVAGLHVIMAEHVKNSGIPELERLSHTPIH